MDRPGRLLLAGALLGLLTVALGAFGAHALHDRLGPVAQGWWQKAVFYQGLHALALLVTGLFALQRPDRLLGLAAWALLLGVLLFSGSLYLMALGAGRWLGAVTPLGGSALLLGWGALAAAAWRLPSGR